MIRYRLGPLLLLALAGCATDPGKYPSLAIRDAERVSGTARPVQPYVPPAPSPQVLDRLESLVAEAASAHRAFLSAEPAARSKVNAARQAAVGSDAWSDAQVALASLVSVRNRASAPLAELDELYVQAAIEGRATERIVAARGEVSQMIEAESRTIAALASILS